LVERRTVNPYVVGSCPTSGAISENLSERPNQRLTVKVENDLTTFSVVEKEYEGNYFRVLKQMTVFSPMIYNLLKGNIMKTKFANPMLTKTGKKRLGPMNMKQLTEFLDSSSKPKDKAKIRNRIAIVEKRQSPQNIGSDVPAL